MGDINYVPIIKVINLLNLERPIKVMVVSRDNDTLWWKFKECVPEIQMDPRSSVSFVANRDFGGSFSTYLISHTFYTIYMYNKLILNNPTNYLVSGSTIFYFFNNNEVITIPYLFRHPFLTVILTQINGRPVLKISVEKQS